MCVMWRASGTQVTVTAVSSPHTMSCGVNRRSCLRHGRVMHNRNALSALLSYTTSYYHIVFRTYRSEHAIPFEHERELYAYIYGIAKNLRCQTYRIGGMPDHIHIFVSLPSDLSLASFVQRVKSSSSKWMKDNPNFPDFRGWGREYAGFSYSLRDKDKIVRYIMRQKEHHGATTFADEYRAFIEENGAPIDERYFLNDD